MKISLALSLTVPFVLPSQLATPASVKSSKFLLFKSIFRMAKILERGAMMLSPFIFMVPLVPATVTLPSSKFKSPFPTVHVNKFARVDDTARGKNSNLAFQLDCSLLRIECLNSPFDTY